MAGYSVTYTVVDNATKQIDAINRKIGQMRAPVERMSKQVSRFVDVSGLRKVAQGFDYIWKSAGSVLRTLTEIVPVMGTITGAATLAGMVKLVRTYADWSHELVQAASLIGTTTQKLQQFEDATRLAGGNAADMRQSLSGLHDTLANMNIGAGNFAEAAQWFNKLGINVRNANGTVNTMADQVLPELIKKLAAMTDPADRARASIALLGSGGDKLVESFRQSSKPFEDWIRDVQRYKDLTDEQKRSLQLFTEAQGRLGVGVDRLGQQISVMMAEHLTPMLNSFSNFVEQNTPAILEATRQIGTAFGELWTSIVGDTTGESAIKTIRDTIHDLLVDLKWLVDKGNDLAAILNRLSNIHSWKDLTKPILPSGETGTVVPSQGLPGPRLNPAVEDALGKFWDRIMKGPENIRPGYQQQSSSGGYLPGGVTRASYGGAAAISGGGGGEFFLLLGLAVQKGFEAAFDHLRSTGGAVGAAGGGGSGVVNASYQPGGGGGGGGSGGAQPPVTALGPAAPGSYNPARESGGSTGERNRNPLNLTALPGQAAEGRFRHFNTWEEGVAAAVHQLQINTEKHGTTTLAQQIARWAPPGENNTGAYIGRVAKEMGIDPNAPLNTRDPETLRRLVNAMSHVELNRQIPMDAITKGVGMATGTQIAVPPPAPVNGSVDVSITHNNPPPNTSVTAKGAGAVNVAPVRVEHQDMANI